jgi:DNA-binding SARP family transcriptional activator
MLTHLPAAYVVQLLGKFDAKAGKADLAVLEGRKMQELLGYLLLFRERPHHREILAGALWPDSTTAQSKKYLRQSLWQLGTLQGTLAAQTPVVLADEEWVHVNSDRVWLDVAQLEQAFAPVKTTPGEQVAVDDAEVLKTVVPLYRGDLLEGCFQDWCVYERERLKAMYLALLEKLLGYCEARGQPEEGFAYGERLLRYERAHERAHWRLMRLHYIAGDRTGALRQFERCRDALREELGIAPGERIRLLCEQIRADTGIDPQEITARSPLPAHRPASATRWVPTRPEDEGQIPAHKTQLGSGPQVESLREILRTLSRAERLLKQSIREAETKPRLSCP